MTSMSTRTLLARAPWLFAAVLACGGGGPDATAGATQTSDASTSTTEAATTSTGESPTTGGTTSTSTTSTSTGEATTDATDTAVAPTSTGSTSTGETTSTASTDSTSSTDSTTDGTSTGSTSTTGEPGELGEISGECGLIDAMELLSPMPFVFTGAIDFGVAGFDYDLLTPGGQQIYDEGNLNPGSLASEIVAYEVLARCELATLLKTEATVVYDDPMGKKTDLLVELDGHKVGVSVARAVGFPFDAPYTVMQAQTLLTGKLSDISISSENVAAEDAWVKQILHIVAYAPGHVDSLLTAFAAIDPMIKADTILVVTVTNGEDGFIY